jgi:6-phosphogluconate dehydrogenase
MVHNGIEYGDMQLIAEAYDILKNVAGLTNEQLLGVFEDWNKSELRSFLIEITTKVVNFPDPDGSGKPLTELIVDKVGMKGTGTWTIKAALDMQVPVPTMAAAVDAREISMLQDQRKAAEKVLPGPNAAKWTGDQKALIEDVKHALYCSKICSYAQGMAMLSAANLPNLLVHPRFKEMIASRQDAWRRTVALAIQSGVGTPAFSASLAYYDSYRRERLPGNLVQAQRDYFGAHTYERNEQPGTFIHTEWSHEQPAHEVPEGTHGAHQVGTTQHPKGD